MSDSDEILAEHLRTRWEGLAHLRATELLARGTPDDALALVLGSLGAIRESTTFVADAVSFVSEADLTLVAEAVIAQLCAADYDDNAANLLAHIALQSPKALHRHLATLFDIAVDDGGYELVSAWRESEHLAFDDLRRVLETEPPNSDEHRLARDALLETRTTTAIELVTRSKHIPDENAPHASLEAALREVDLTFAGDGSVRPITHPRVKHLVFPTGHLHLGPAWLSIHPTWHLDTTNAPRARFGGAAEGRCNGCEGPLHHLLTLDPVPEGIGVTSVSKLSLVACLDCLGSLVPMESFEHDERGGTRDVTRQDPGVPEFRDGPLLETTVCVVDTPPRWRWQDWATSNSRENLHRISGHPCWIQGPEIPDCPKCRDSMCFVLQLDSELPCATTSSHLWGSGGLAYVFWCDACRVSTIFWQCT